MLTKSEKYFSLIFILILIIELFASNINSISSIHYLAKPALLISLLLYFWKNSSHLQSKTRRYMMLALSFSLLGDILLMFVTKSQLFFITGLVAFLLAHVFYVIVFLQKRNTSKKAILFILIMLAYAFALFYFLKNGLGDLLIPVVVYMIVILTMSTSAFLRKEKVSILSYNFVFIGAILFMISDSLLALNKFYKPVLCPEISIMITYAFAQLSIVYGILKQR